MLLTEIILQANSLTSLHQFYKEVMDLPVSFSDESTLQVQVGKSTLIFEKNSGLVQPFYHIAFNIPSNQFDEVYAWFKPKVEFLWVEDYKSYIADFKNWNAKSFYFYDPEGNILEVISRRDLNYFSAFPFSGKSIFNVSELGIVFSAHNYEVEVEEFMRIFSLQFFIKQPPGPHFSVCGDEQGLFIMVPEGRNWYPETKKKSVHFPLTVSFTTENGQFKWDNNH